MATENKTVLLKIDLDVAGLKKNADDAVKELEKLKIQQSLLRANNKQGTVEYAKISEGIKVYTKQLKDNASAMLTYEELQGKTSLNTVEQARHQRALAVAYNNLTAEQRESNDAAKEITEQYTQSNKALNAQTLAVGSGVRNIGLYQDSIVKAHKEIAQLTKQTTQVGYAMNQTTKDIDKTKGEMDALAQSGQQDTIAFVKLQDELNSLNETFTQQDEVMSELNSALSEQQSELASTETEARKIGFVYGENATSVSSLRKELKDMQDVMASTDANSDEFIEASIRAGELKDKLNEVKGATADLAGGTSFEKMSNTLGAIGGDLENLDFEGVAEKAKALQEISSKMTFAELRNGLKSMSSAFISLGKAILANPLFLLVAVLAAVGTALYMFSQKEQTAEEESDKLTASISRQNAIFDRNSEAIKRNAKFKVDLAKAQGKSTKEVANLELQALQTSEKLRRDELAKNKAQLMEKKRLYMVALDEENEEIAKKLHEEIVQDKQAIQDLKAGRQKYYQDRQLLQINTENTLKAEREKAKEKQIADEQAVAEKQKENFEKYKDRKNAELELAKEIAKKIRDVNFESASQTQSNLRTQIDNEATYKKKVAENTISDAVALNEALIQIEKDRQQEIKAVDQKERELSIQAIRTGASDEISELKGSKEKIAEQTKAINEKMNAEILAVDLEFQKQQQDIELSNVEALKKLEDAKVAQAKETNAKILLDLENNVQKQLNANKDASQQEIDLAIEKNKQIQEDETKSLEEKALAQSKFEAEITAIRKTEADKQKALDDEVTAKRKENQQAVTDASQELISTAFQLQQQNIQKDIEATTTANQEKQTELQKQFDNGLISSQDYEAKKLALENQGRDAERKIKKKQFEADKKASIIQAGIATALAVAKALPNPVLATLAGVLGLAQVALIANAPTPAFAKGGKVLSGQRIGRNDGKSIFRSNGDNLLATVKTGEIIANKTQQNYIESVAGADIWQRAGIDGFASGGLVSSGISDTVNSQIDSENVFRQAIANLPSPVVLVQDINNGQSNLVRTMDSANI